MGKKKGKYGCYIPGDVWIEIDKLKREKGILSHSEAMRQMVKYSKVGMEAERLHDFAFFGRPRKKR